MRRRRKSGLQRERSPWSSRYRCYALTTDQWRHMGADHVVRIAPRHMIVRVVILLPKPPNQTIKTEHMRTRREWNKWMTLTFTVNGSPGKKWLRVLMNFILYGVEVKTAELSVDISFTPVASKTDATTRSRPPSGNPWTAGWRFTSAVSTVTDASPSSSCSKKTTITQLNIFNSIVQVNFKLIYSLITLHVNENKPLWPYSQSMMHTNIRNRHRVTGNKNHALIVNRANRSLQCETQIDTGVQAPLHRATPDFGK